MSRFLLFEAISLLPDLCPRSPLAAEAKTLCRLSVRVERLKSARNAKHLSNHGKSATSRHLSMEGAARQLDKRHLNKIIGLIK